jgi:serine/threonine protein kinase
MKKSFRDHFIGAEISGYRFLEVIGEGGFAWVFRAEHILLQKAYAIKVLKPDKVLSPHFISRFKNEAKIAAGLSHPHIVNVSNFFSLQPDFSPVVLHFLVMEFIEGTPLNQMIKKEGVLSLNHTIRFAKNMARALEYIHKPIDERPRGLVHRDIASKNVMITPDGFSILMDFGIVKGHFEDETGEYTATGAIMGSWAYMSPEQSLGDSSIDHRSDLYSLGVVIYEMLTGRTPFTGSSAQILYGHRSQSPPSPLKLRTFIRDEKKAAQDLARIILRCLEKKPEKRYQSAHDLLQDLNRISPVEQPILFKLRRQFWTKLSSAFNRGIRLVFRKSTLMAFLLIALTIVLMFSIPRFFELWTQETRSWANATRTEVDTKISNAESFLRPYNEVDKDIRTENLKEIKYRVTLISRWYDDGNYWKVHREGRRIIADLQDLVLGATPTQTFLPTSTFTETPTHTQTPTDSPTQIFTPTAFVPPTHTFTPTATLPPPTDTFTPTSPTPPTQTFTPTALIAQTHTFTPTATLPPPTDTFTPTIPTPPTQTFTPTAPTPPTHTPTPTTTLPPPTDTFTPTHTPIPEINWTEERIRSRLLPEWKNIVERSRLQGGPFRDDYLEVVTGLSDLNYTVERFGGGQIKIYLDRTNEYKIKGGRPFSGVDAAIEASWENGGIVFQHINIGAYHYNASTERLVAP